MKSQPILRTERLLLRPFTLADAPTVQLLAGDKAIADTTLSIPHPYPDGLAERWIKTHPSRFRDERGAIYAITLAAEGTLLGSIGLVVYPTHNRAELGYWLGKSYWGRGYATEAAHELVHYGFEKLDLNRIYAQHFARNPASGRIMQKIGMAYEGTLQQHILKWDAYEDMVLYAILRKDSAATSP